MKLEARMSKLEETVQKHLQESGVIQTKLTFNTWLTGIVLAAILGQWIKGLF